MAKSGEREQVDNKGDPATAGAEPRPKRGAQFVLRVLVIRHAIAEEPETFKRTGEPDGLRPLTHEGRRKMRRAVRGLAQVLPRLDVIATSPLTRALQTAEIVAGQYGKVKTHRVPALAPGKAMNAVIAWLAGQPAGRTVAIVGHQPYVGEFVSWTLTGLRESFHPMKKGAACLIEFSDEVKAGRATLLWSLKPSHMRALAR